MAGVADKARFYLEQSVPQLREFEDKEIFTKDEIRNLVRKRTDFEHRVLAPGSRAADYLAYIEWEKGLEALRARRCKRLLIRQLNHGHAGTARLTAIHERAVTRDPGSIALWRSYLTHLARVGASKRWRRVSTRALRLHPQEPSLWTLAGRRAADNGDMDGARAYFMRGCRFCNRGPELWIEYARAEMEWLGRMEARGKAGGKAGLLAARAEQTVEDGDQIMFVDDDSDDDGDGLAVFGADDDTSIVPGVPARRAPRLVDEDSVKKLEKSPALGGAIPRAIFDVARKQPFFDADSAAAFFDMFARFPTLVVQPGLVRHVLDAMAESFPRDPATWYCRVRQPLIGVEPTGAEFPGALREALAGLRLGMGAADKPAALAARTVALIQSILALAGDNLDKGVRTVLEHMEQKMEAAAASPRDGI